MPCSCPCPPRHGRRRICSAPSRSRARVILAVSSLCSETAVVPGRTRRHRIAKEEVSSRPLRSVSRCEHSTFNRCEWVKRFKPRSAAWLAARRAWDYQL
jgi:hypothetical protein